MNTDFQISGFSDFHTFRRSVFERFRFEDFHISGQCGYVLAHIYPEKFVKTRFCAHIKSGCICACCLCVCKRLMHDTGELKLGV